MVGLKDPRLLQHPIGPRGVASPQEDLRQADERVDLARAQPRRDHQELLRLEQRSVLAGEARRLQIGVVVARIDGQPRLEDLARVRAPPRFIERAGERARVLGAGIGPETQKARIQIRHRGNHARTWYHAFVLPRCYPLAQRPRRRASRSRSRLLAFAVLGASLLACGPTSGSPAGTVRAFARALETRRFDDAYDFLGESFRRRVPENEFVRRLETNPEEVRELVALLRWADDEDSVRTVLDLPDGESVELRFEGGSWRIHRPGLAVYDQSTPRAALRSFIRALERRRYDIILRFVPTADREGMSEERLREAFEGDERESIEQLVEALRQNRDNPIEEVGTRATMAYGEGLSVQFVREDGVWKIENPE